MSVERLFVFMYAVFFTALAVVIIHLVVRTERTVCDERHTLWLTMWRDGKPHPYATEVCDRSHEECWDGNRWGPCLPEVSP